ncbi:MAG: hypothetical protein KDI69_08110 [Xanthomonadales bacterium]|nr:hypothetical protein [Xanthomonadales bacterium]MCC6440354.1 hypothetical protein [Rhodanobacteraceae bacterium]
MYTIHPHIVRTLDMEHVSGLPAFLSAGSGLVMVGAHVHVIADDALHIASFHHRGTAPGTWLRVFPGQLPSDAAARKALKPDLEALLHLPSLRDHPHGALLALPSGSTPSRNQGVLLSLADDGAIAGPPVPIDFSMLYNALRNHVPALNIEGATTIDDHLILLHRGSRPQPRSALIFLPLTEFQDALQQDRAIGAMSDPSVQWFIPGTIDGATLAITDGAALPDGRLVISAVAELAEDNYLDGPCISVAIAIVGRDGMVDALFPLEPALKVEGVQAWLEGQAIRVLLVTDADDPTTPSVLLEAFLPTTQLPRYLEAPSHE